MLTASATLKQPLEGCIVVNLADLLSIFSGGIL
jgi:isopenicillin N synthase-like dioxygenase